MRISCSSHRRSVLAVLAFVAEALGATIHISPTGHAQQAFFMGLGNVPGWSTDPASGPYASDISYDGSVVVGGTSVGDGDAYRWTRATGMISLNAPTAVNAMYVSSDGNTVVGDLGSGINPSAGSFRWTQATGRQALPGLHPVWGVNGDGSVAVGQTYIDDAWRAVRWTAAGGTSRIGSLDVASRALAVSDDGLKVAGNNGDSLTSDTRIPFILDITTGAETVLPFPASESAFDVEAMSGDGRVVVGLTRASANDRRVIRWSAETGANILPPASDGAVPFHFHRSSIAFDGSVIVGAARGGVDPTPIGNNMFIWDTVHGTRNLRQLLIHEYGLGPQLAGWTIPRGNYFGVSGDGKTVYGDGLNPAGNREPWIAYLGTPVPESSALALAGTALAALALRRRSYLADG